jgi:hypothetical protein
MQKFEMKNRGSREQNHYSQTCISTTRSWVHCDFYRCIKRNSRFQGSTQHWGVKYITTSKVLIDMNIRVIIDLMALGTSTLWSWIFAQRLLIPVKYGRDFCKDLRHYPKIKSQVHSWVNWEISLCLNYLQPESEEPIQTGSMRKKFSSQSFKDIYNSIIYTYRSVIFGW